MLTFYKGCLLIHGLVLSPADGDAGVEGGEEGPV